MHGHQQSRDGEELVVTHTVTARLLGVAGESRLLVSPNAFSSNDQDQDTEDEDDREPNASNACRVPVYAANHGTSNWLKKK
uniref:Uncharacterized protein n=1 Tax=Cynoglossus semilaevis TaxID=244447 RepID=A0A3P8WE42_CYNSE